MLPRLAYKPWIIPARAGFTPCIVERTDAGRDHPRSRGVYRPAPPPSPCRGGSSPLARGLRMVVATLPAILVGSSPLARGLQGASLR